MALNTGRISTAAVAVASLATAALSMRLFLSWSNKRRHKQNEHEARDTLPRDLETWRVPNTSEDCKRIWEVARPAFSEAGIYLWPYDGAYSRADPRTVIRSNGFAYVTPVRGEEWSTNLQKFNCSNELTRGGTIAGGLHVVLRVVAIGNEGQQHLEILRKLARGTRSILMDNHVVPLWKEVHLGNTTFTVSPYVAHSMDDCYGFWAKNSVGDIVDMIIQSLEAIAFVHELGIAHRDLSKANYVVQWHPESLSTMRIPLSRPRVFLIDFETASEFPPELPVEQRLLTGHPMKYYQRPLPPEVASGKPHDPFKADIWQLAKSLSDFKATVAEIDAVLEQMLETDVSHRLSAVDARDQLAAVVHGMPAATLLIPPLVLKSSDDF